MIEISYSDSIAIVTFEHAPVNALSVTADVVDGLSQAIGDTLLAPHVEAVVVMAGGRMFSAGADIADFDIRSDTLDRIRHLTSDVIEAANKPVIMAIHGMALGGGLELALSGHYRICAPGTRFALPEVTLGLLPGAGGTQRLPRLVGMRHALDMMLSGKTIDAGKAVEIGLVDRLCEKDLRTEAVQWARNLVAAGPRRATHAMVCDEAESVLAGARERPVSRNPAPRFIVDCVEAAWAKPFADGMALEKNLFETLRHSEESAGLRHVFMGQREVGRLPGGKPSNAVSAIASTAVIGGGLMGTGIAIALLNAGLKVTLVDLNAAALDKAANAISRTIQRDVEKGRLSADAAAARMSALAVSPSMDAIAGVDLVIEAVFESMEVKQSVFEKIDAIAKPDAILASNTSTLDLDRIAGFTSRPERVVGLHFFSPANIMKLLEVVRGEQTAPDVLAAAMAFAKAIGKVGVVSGVCDGFIGNRLFEEYLRQAYFLLEEGALPAQIDGALERWGMAMGPLKVMDLAGQDIGWSIRKRRAIENPERPYSRIPDMICEMGRYGQKTGAGFYLYPDGRTAKHDPLVDQLILDHARDLGIARRAISDEEIVERCMLALVNEGAKAVGEGIAYRPLDIDMTYVFGYGLAPERGGPMFYADRLGVAHVLERIQAYAAGAHGWAWSPAPLLADLVAKGEIFADRNRL